MSLSLPLSDSTAPFTDYGSLVDSFLSQRSWTMEEELHFYTNGESPGKRADFLHRHQELAAAYIQGLLKANQDHASAVLKDVEDTPQSFDITNRALNEALVKEFLSQPEVLGLSPVAVLTLVIKIQTYNALSQNHEDPEKFSLPSLNIFREADQEASHRGEIIMPFVQGEFVSISLAPFLSFLEQEFQNLDPQTAVNKACIYFSLMILLHPQTDFNCRVYRHFFNFLIAKSLGGKGEIPQPFSVPDKKFTPGILHPSWLDVREAVFENLFPEFKGDRFTICLLIKHFFPLLFTHNTNPKKTFEDSLAGANLGPIEWQGGTKLEDKWLMKARKGVEMVDVEYFVISSGCSKKVSKEDLFRRLKSIEGLDERPEYFTFLLHAGRSVEEQMGSGRFSNFEKMVHWAECQK